MRYFNASHKKSNHILFYDTREALKGLWVVTYGVGGKFKLVMWKRQQITIDGNDTIFVGIIWAED